MNSHLSTQWLLGRMIAAAAGTCALAGAALAVSLTTTAACAQPSDSSRPAIQSVALIGITVGDLDREAAFYTQTLAFERVSQSELSGDSIERLTGVFGAHCRVARLRLGDEYVELTQYLAPEGRAIPADSRSNDRWFQHIAIVVSDMDKAYAWLRDHHIRHASSGPQTLPAWNPNAGGISAFYFKDPEGHVLEVIQFPPGKGDPRWQRPTDKLFLGIDHTAIVVGDSDKSIAFYRDVLGMRIAGTSENYGIEQEHLNNVFGARLRITALRAASGPGVELLDYLSPRDGRAYPLDARTNDLIGWTTVFTTPDASDVSKRLGDARVTWISPGLVRDAGPWETACEIRDPDGHVLLIGRPSPARAGGETVENH